MLLGTLMSDDGALTCLVGVERTRIVVVAQDDLARFSWPEEQASMDPSMRSLIISGDDQTNYRFVPDLPDRFRWVMTAALQEAHARRDPWWRRIRAGATHRGLGAKLVSEQAAA